MRFLLLSDTHGELDIINELASLTRADAVLHAGDFGFYDSSSLDRLSEREIRLLVKYSSLEERARILADAPTGLAEAVREHRLLGGFQALLDGEKSLNVPVYAVWGNHEDTSVVERLFRGDIAVKNLHILHHQKAYCLGPVFLYGLGGNLLPGSKMLQRPIAGGRGKVWSTLSQFADLVTTVERDAGAARHRILVTHVSPGKEAFVEHIAARTGATYTVSGHMGAPTCMVWNPFAISSIEDARERLLNGMHAVEDACLGAGRNSAAVAEMLRIVADRPNERTEADEHTREPRWYRSMTHVNLPDADTGYAVMDVDGDNAHLQCFLTRKPDP